MYTEFRSNLAQITEIDWDAVDARDWRAPETKEGKQAELLIYEKFPCHLIERIGVSSAGVYSQVRATLGSSAQPVVEIKRDWYY
jgi:hypothetical protein